MSCTSMLIRSGKILNLMFKRYLGISFSFVQNGIKLEKYGCVLYENNVYGGNKYEM